MYRACTVYMYDRFKWVFNVYQPEASPCSVSDVEIMNIYLYIHGSQNFCKGLCVFLDVFYISMNVYIFAFVMYIHGLWVSYTIGIYVNSDAFRSKYIHVCMSIQKLDMYFTFPAGLYLEPKR